MEQEPKKRGRRLMDPASKRRSYTISLSPAEIVAIEAKAAAEASSPSAYVIKKLKLDKPA